ncbi:molybdenum cofactor biosynthesis protein MoaE [Oceanidesulfovibrio indonesiensis]|uniref:molybdenum cofactor biosynthesis protein MoaE n=1 Tax=Oceanidesulfovibrio indonesiensis TaxID=54767 RepID=UPI003F668115
MSADAAIAAIKQEPGFTENVGMILVHNGVVRATSRKDTRAVTAVDISVDLDRVEALRQEFEKYPGIFRVHAEARSGTLVPGDDVLLLVVAGDIRENVKAALAEFLDRVKSEAVSKVEHLVD